MELSAPQSSLSLAPALCVDLDGTLIATDLLAESVMRLLRQRPLDLCLIPGWLVQGKCKLKRELAQRLPIDPTTLPYRAEVLAYLRQQKKAGQTLVLTTAAHHTWAQAVADHLGLFDQVIATPDAGPNCRGQIKVEAIRAQLGQTFDYLGDSAVDLLVWEHARERLIVARSSRVLGHLERQRPGDKVFYPHTSQGWAMLQAMRPLHWVKNILLAVPMCVGHAVTWSHLFFILLAMIAFSLVASSGYLINDLLDLSADRQHASKCKRALASGRLWIMAAIPLAVGLLSAGVLLGLVALPWSFVGLLLVYLALTVLYSLTFKRCAILDVIVLAGLYTLRVVAGGAAVSVEPSFWLLAFSAFVFLSLAFAKRDTELSQLKDADHPSVPGRGYHASDLELVRLFGVAAGFMSVLVFALYLNSPDVTHLYALPKVLWFMIPVLLYWVCRIWLFAARGMLHDDPVVFTLRDRQSWVCGILAILLIVMAS